MEASAASAGRAGGTALGAGAAEASCSLGFGAGETAGARPADEMVGSGDPNSGAGRRSCWKISALTATPTRPTARLAAR